MTTINITRIQKQVLDEMDRVHRLYMNHPIEKYVSNKVLKRISYEDRRTLIMNTPVSKIFDLETIQFVTPTFKERFENCSPDKEERYNIFQLDSLTEGAIKTDSIISISLDFKKNKEQVGQKQHFLDFEETDREKMKDELQKTYNFSVIIINALQSIVNEYYDFRYEQKLRSKMFKNRFGGRGSFEIKKTPDWIEMYADCIKFKENHQYIENILN
jgi:hypothetical protein